MRHGDVRVFEDGEHHTGLREVCRTASVAAAGCSSHPSEEGPRSQELQTEALIHALRVPESPPEKDTHVPVLFIDYTVVPSKLKRLKRRHMDEHTSWSAEPLQNRTAGPPG